MYNIDINKDELLAIVKKNKTKHQELYDMAVEGYKEEVKEKLEEALQLASSGEKYITDLNLSEPQSHIKEYDRVIGMLELSTSTEVTLDTNQYDQYVDDQWHWAGQTRSINTMYANKMSKS